jgi:serine/threonine-protein kinase
MDPQPPKPSASSSRSSRIEEAASSPSPSSQPTASDDLALTQEGPEQDTSVTRALEPSECIPTQKGVTEALSEGAGGGKLSESKDQKLKQLGEFRLIKVLGSGGMGAVYKARQISLDRDVALKVLPKHLVGNKTFVERFKREARLMAKLDHPNILHCYGSGEDHGFHFLAVEYGEAGSMQHWLNKLGKLEVGDALHAVIACARALEYAHEQGLIHRDIKPDNILLTAGGVVKLADLGLAKAITEDAGLTRTGTAAGTPLYMSPEQARDVKRVDARSDIYSLGCMLYCFLAGRPPFQGETLVEINEAKEKGKYPPSRRFNPNVPERLDLYIDKMLAKLPEYRYSNCSELIKDLEGLDLANSNLSFLGKSVSGTTSRSPVSTPPKKSMTKTMPTSIPSAASNIQAEDPNIWYVSYMTKKGMLVTNKMTTAQVQELIRDRDFDPKAQASHRLKGGFRSVATYPEFEPALRGRLVQAKADRKAAKFKSMYGQIEKEQERLERRRWFRNLFRGTMGWVTFLIYITLIGGAVYVVYLLFRFGLAYVIRKLEGMTQE